MLVKPKITIINYYILLSVIEPAHGYLIMKRIEELTQGKYKMSCGTLYGALEKLTQEGMITTDGVVESRRKVYSITQKGIDLIKEEKDALENLYLLTQERLNEYHENA